MLNNKVSKAVRLAIAFGATSTAAFSASSIAADEGVEKVERIEVTGSRIKRTDMETSQPILTITSADIDRSGLSGLNDVLKEISTNGASLGLQTNNGNTSGTSTVNLRNCGSSRTLVLVNGRRWVSELGGGVDVSTIPLAAVKTIDILKDGASSVYGTDAICGVVNVITRNDYDGAEVKAYIGETSEGDGRRESYSATFGSTTNKGSALLNVSYTKQEAIMGGDREISSVPIYGLPANISGSGGRASPTTPFGGFPVDLDGDGVAERYTLNKDAQGCAPNKTCTGQLADFKLYDRNTDGYNFAPVNYIQQPQETISLYGQASYEVLDDVLWTLSAMYNERSSTAQLAAQPLGGMSVSKDSVYNPFGQDINGAAFRPIVSPRSYSTTATTWRFNTALQGEFSALDRFFTWDASATYADNNVIQLKNGFFHSGRVDESLGKSFINSDGEARCGTADNIITGCVPFNIFGGPDGVTPEMLDYLTVSPRDITYTKMWDYTANIGTELFELPAGPVGFVVGTEIRRESGYDSPEPLTVLGQVLGDNAATPTKGGFNLKEYYSEVNIPILADMPFVESLELGLATRYSDYSTFGSTTNSSAKLTYRPTSELLIRSSVSEGFRAPSLSDLYQGQSDSRPPGTDPCSTDSNEYKTIASVRERCAAEGVSPTFIQAAPQFEAVVGGNPDVEPETSKSYTLGFVYSPEFIDGLGVSVDWYRIEIENFIGSRSAGSIASRCYEQGLDCELITRDFTGTLNGNIGEISRLVSTTMNFLGGNEREGLDFNIDYRFSNDMGNWRINSDTAYVIYDGDIGKLNEGDLTPDIAISSGNTAGRLTKGASGGGSNHRIKSNLTLSWNNDDFAASLTAQYFSKLVEDCTGIITAADGLGQPELKNLCSDPDNKGNTYRLIPGTTNVEVTENQPLPENKLSPTVYLDAQGSWYTPYNSTISVGIRNLLDKEPPKAYSAFANTYDPAYRTPGRFFYVSFTQKF
ncbi:TonB-dependent receptor plug domain-containing protein [Pseudoalteromonas rhizosphaerae]|uniref:TonB-dependent receptor plug domain-containing protein n=1 Tax=Pseudoalteromonas rhizosphaerae TaxID=2518973 RepID=UPI0015D2B8E2|nr:TonB-dependent receptor [Pseudoalteromonas rhizosphaerae]